jgi:hypothetical protein
MQPVAKIYKEYTMNPLVFMILACERDMKAHQKAYRLQDDEVKISKPAPHIKQKNRRWFFYRLRQQKSCECS